MNSQNKFIQHGPCAKCGSSDANAHYERGDSFCFSCRAYTPPTNSQKTEYRKPVVCFPTDLTSEIPLDHVKWLEARGLTLEEIHRLYVYSPSWDRIVYFTRRPEFVEARSTKKNRYPKSIQIGEKPFPHFNSNSDIVVCVEDLISATIVGRLYGSMCLFGSMIPNKILLRLSNLPVKRIVIWLDKDKWPIGQIYAKKLHTLGASASAIFSNEDPKKYSNMEIKNFVEYSHKVAQCMI